MQVAYDRAYEEGRYIDAQEANYIRAIEREPVAALWKILTDPAGNNYYLPKFTPVEERLDGLKRPLVGKGSDTMIYVKSDDDLAGLRIAIRRPPQERGDGGLETAAIIPFRWVKGSGVVPLDPPDNLRVLIQLKKDGEHAMLGMSFSLTHGRRWNLGPPARNLHEPEVWRRSISRPRRARSSVRAAAWIVMRWDLTSRPASSSVRRRAATPSLSARSNKCRASRAFSDDARKKGASEQEIAQGRVDRRPTRRPYPHVGAACGSRSSNCGTRSTTPISRISTTPTAGSSNITTSTARPGSKPAISTRPSTISTRRSAAVPMWRPSISSGGGSIREKIAIRTRSRDLDQSIKLEPKLAFAFAARSTVHAKSGQLDLALRDAEDAVRLGPKLAAAYVARAEIEMAVGDYQRSLADADRAIGLQSHLAGAHNVRARLLATAPVADLRNGASAVSSATRACELAGWQSSQFLETLAAAYAESADFPEAVKWQEKALADLDVADSNSEADTKAVRDRLELYRKNLPYRDTPRAQPAGKAG